MVFFDKITNGPHSTIAMNAAAPEGAPPRRINDEKI